MYILAKGHSRKVDLKLILSKKTLARSLYILLMFTKIKIKKYKFRRIQNDISKI